MLDVFRALNPTGDVALLGEMAAPEFAGARRALGLLQEAQDRSLAQLTVADLASRPA
ncbi:MAG: hypothetical protein HY303_00090 [Candidatus Wallbacteria bacterium]|nr:hypothetical protein [Candidatus Wallbacteria bacterium]